MGKLLVNLLVLVSLSGAGAALAATAGSHYTKGVEFFKKRYYDQAIQEFTKAVEINPKFAKAYAVRGVIYAAQGRFNEAMADSDKALEINPRLALAYETRALGYYAKRNFDKAWYDVHKAERLGYKVNSRFLQNLRQSSGRQTELILPVPSFRGNGKLDC
jgi:tetratricopeptide (TPR) repeat protein